MRIVMIWSDVNRNKQGCESILSAFVNEWKTLLWNGEGTEKGNNSNFSISPPSSDIFQDDEEKTGSGDVDTLPDFGYRLPFL